MPSYNRTQKVRATTPSDVRWWIELTPHHIARVADDGTLILKGHLDQLTVPAAVWKRCHVKVAPGPFDTRMYRWDHAAERAQVLQGRRRKTAAARNRAAKRAAVKATILTEVSDEAGRHSAPADA